VRAQKKLLFNDNWLNISIIDSKQLPETLHFVPGDQEHKKYFLAVGIVSTVIRMPQKRADNGYHHSPPWVRPLMRRVRRRGHVISFHSPVMSPLLPATKTSAKKGKHHAILRP
jgi:hypothetical protein